MPSSSSSHTYTPDPSSLSSLSSQLLSLNLTTKPLDLVPIFSPPAQSPLSSSQLAADARAREALLRCIWAMLEARQQMGETLEKVDGMGRVRDYELERAEGMVKVERRKAAVAEKEAEGERAKARAAQAALATEQERHRHCREELAKARSALQFVKTQSQLDLKRREAEATATTSRLQKLSADPTQSKFVVLNPGALPSTATASTTSDRSTARRGPAALSATSAADSSRLEAQVELTAAVQAEVAMLQEALEGSEQDRQRAEYENKGLRELVGEVDEWAGAMLKLRGIGDGSEVEVADESFSIPAPHLSLPLDLLAPPLQKRLSIIEDGVSVLLTSVAAREELVRAEMQGALDEQRLAKAEERVKRTHLERELEAEREKAAQAARLMDQFAEGAFKVIEEEEDDEEVVKRRSSGVKGVKQAVTGQDRLEEAKMKASKAKEAAGVEKVEAPVVAKSAAAAEAEAARARTVASFLSELDTPQPQPAIKSAKLLAAKPPPAAVSSRPGAHAEQPAARTSSTATGSSRLATAAVEKPRASSSRSSDLASRPTPSSRTSDSDHRPSSKPSLSSSSSTHRSAPAPSSSSSSAERKSALAGILALGESPEAEQGGRVLSSTRVMTTTTAKVTASARPRAEGRASKENALPREREREVVRPLREGERYKVF